MTQRPLKDVVKEHVEDRALNREQLTRLDALLHNDQDAHIQRRYPLMWGALVATIFLGLGWWLSTQTSPDASIAQRIAQEVASNHLKLKPLEVQGDSIEQTQTFFAKLDFKLVTDSEVLRERPWTLKGGRYCSIQGEDAAQLRFASAGSSEPISVYMSPYDPQKLGTFPNPRLGQKPLRVDAKGIEVLIWVEKNVLIATTSP